MAKNDVIILDGIIDDRVQQKMPSERRDEAFEFLAIQQILKDFSPSGDEIINGNVDGKDDGGIDALYIYVNGHCIDDVEDFNWPKTNIDFQIFILTCKHHDTFKQAPLDNLVATLSEYVDFAITNDDLKGDYNEQLLKKRNILKTTYRKCASRLASMQINLSYASRGDSENVGESIQSRADQLKKIAKSSFGNCEAYFTFYGSTELVDLYRRKPNFSIELPFIEYFGRGERYVLLARLADYFEFVTDEENKLRRYLFDSNVRDFMGVKGVNEDIRNTLENVNSADFWWLNNGVTMLATSARVIGKSIQIEDIQIVNGLQTTESIFNHFHAGNFDPNDRSVLVKVLVSKDANVRDAIIRATNNQTNVEIPALHATDKIQRDIEDILLKSNFYYERRTRYYANLNIQPSLIISPLYVAAAYINLIHRNPGAASILKQKFMRNTESYEEVFSEKVNANLWPQIVKIMKRTDEFLELGRPHLKGGTEGFLKRWRQILAFLVVSKKLKKFNYSESELLALKIDTLTDQDFEVVWQLIRSLFTINNSYKRNPTFVKPIVINAAFVFDIKGIEILGYPKTDQLKPGINGDIDLPQEFIDQVNQILPPQPWNKKTYKDTATLLFCPEKKVRDAAAILINQGKRFYQRNTFLYDRENDRVIS